MVVREDLWMRALEALLSVQSRHLAHIPVNLSPRVRQTGRQNPVLAGQVCRRDQTQVPTEQLQQPGQVRHSASNVLLDVEAVGDTERHGGGGHELHQPYSPFRDRKSVVQGKLDLDDRLECLARYLIEIGRA